MSAFSWFNHGKKKEKTIVKLWRCTAGFGGSKRVRNDSMWMGVVLAAGMHYDHHYNGDWY